MGIYKKIKCVNIYSNEEKIFNSVSDAARAFNCAHQKISMAMKQERPTMGYYFYPYLESDRYEPALESLQKRRRIDELSREIISNINQINSAFKALLEFIREDENSKDLQ